MENLLDRLFCKYVLVINKASGFYVHRYFLTYDEMEDYAIYLQFTPNVKKVWEMYKKNHKLVRCFTLR